MEQEFISFKQNMDIWVKDLSSDINTLKFLPSLIAEHSENIDHNYELLQQMRAEINKLKDELSALRMVQLLHLKADVKQRS